MAVSAQASAQRILLDGDFRALRRHWSELFPHLQGPKDDGEAEQTMHYARTEAQCVPLKLRAWSHRWLTERDLPSALPDELRPKAEQMCPIVVSGVGIAVMGNDPEKNAASIEIRRSMENAVLEAEADGRLEDSAFVRARMEEARANTHRLLFGQRPPSRLRSLINQLFAGPERIKK